MTVDLGDKLAHLALIDLNYQENLEMDITRSRKFIEDKYGLRRNILWKIDKQISRLIFTQFTIQKLIF